MDGMEGVPVDPELYEESLKNREEAETEETGDIAGVNEDFTEAKEPEQVDTANLSWEELAVALGFGEEISKAQGKGNTNSEEESNKVSVSEYKAKKNEAKDKKEKDKKKKKRASDIGKDLRPFERYVEGKLALIAHERMGKDHPIDRLSHKLKAAGLSYNYLREQLQSTPEASYEGFIPEDIDDLNLNICVDLINIADECIFLETTDIANVLIEDYVRVWTPQMLLIKEWLSQRKTYGNHS